MFSRVCCSCTFAGAGNISCSSLVGSGVSVVSQTSQEAEWLHPGWAEDLWVGKAEAGPYSAKECFSDIRQIRKLWRWGRLRPDLGGGEKGWDNPLLSRKKQVPENPHTCGEVELLQSGWSVPASVEACVSFLHFMYLLIFVRNTVPQHWRFSHQAKQALCCGWYQADQGYLRLLGA